MGVKSPDDHCGKCQHDWVNDLVGCGRTDCSCKCRQPPSDCMCRHSMAVHEDYRSRCAIADCSCERYRVPRETRRKGKLMVDPCSCGHSRGRHPSGACTYSWISFGQRENCDCKEFSLKSLDKLLEKTGRKMPGKLMVDDIDAPRCEVDSEKVKEWFTKTLPIDPASVVASGTMRVPAAAIDGWTSLKPSPGALWRKAGGDHDKFVQLMKEVGYIVDLSDLRVGLHAAWGKVANALATSEPDLASAVTALAAECAVALRALKGG